MHYIAWNPIEKKMVMGSDNLIQLLLVYLYKKEILTSREIEKLRLAYALKKSYREKDLNSILKDVN
ncbi:hypothetical protein HNQ92_001088 [Rhabdobacter roseus]|uniref:Uncharacterized protein n=1 Tax=Rhabdobacter roseus TaxID=1655419 RepID=A0A840TN43_9BACT|nr:hypothetical protein [Rhabdobacter roseus]